MQYGDKFLTPTTAQREGEYTGQKLMLKAQERFGAHDNYILELASSVWVPTATIDCPLKLGLT